MSDTQDQARRLYEKTLDLLRPLKEGVKRTVDVTTLNVQISGLKRSLDEASREIGRQAIEALRQRGQLRADEVTALLRRVDDIEDQIAQKERQIADIERTEGGPAGTG